MTTGSGSGRRGARLLDSPVIGLLPWIIFAVVVGPGRFELGVGLSLACALAVVAAGRIWRPHSSWKLLELCDVVFFAVLAVVGALAADGTSRWLETYAGEIANIALVLIAFGSMAFRAPFTLPYAREQVPRSRWDSPLFLRTNYVVTGVWGAAFLVGAVAGGYADLVQHAPDNIWTGWIIQIAAIVAALRFTRWYPARVRARAAAGNAASPPPDGEP
ncbi:hypothetical protein PUR57_17585 [Streptomyces sp. JV176]|uniref:hypothetical protein n=1 Tax=Streptomyces sp. JV176 TaxID=858630 RepID=UPI002E759AEB|nr:hypothetical protein [Streptomyces sp. JV176]MEE1800459.1 hypothetical protein [Streptomyces sp. JV176]